MLNSKLLIYWYTNIKTFAALKFILDSPDTYEAYILSVLTELNDKMYGEDQCQIPLISSEPGRDFEIYRTLISEKPQPIPELKLYPVEMQQAYSLHPCWVGWAGIFDRKLAKEERVILTYYRKAFLHLLIEGCTNEAYAVMNLAESPFNYEPELLTGNLLYSVNVLRGVFLTPSKLNYKL
jgi:hypothetical protein